MKTILIYLLPYALVLYGHQLRAQNVMISTSGDEPSISMDPNNPGALVAGSNLNLCFTSSDSGRTWMPHTLTSTYGVYGDPCIDVDTSGNFYFFHLSNPPDGHWIDRIVCQKSEDGGNTWSPGTYTGLNGTKNQDKHWSVVDRSNNHIYLTWTQFDRYASVDPQDSSIILFSKSLDGGDTWSSPKRISHTAGDCLDSDNTVEGAVPAVGPNGEIYVAWAGPNGIVFNRSEDEGETWLGHEIPVDPMPGGWDYEIPGIYRCNGLPITKCDLSAGPNRGTIYINWSDQRNGSGDTDIWLSKSQDRGDTWSAPIRVNDDDPGRQQFLTWMDIDQVTGNLFFVFYDRRNYSDNQTDVYLAISTDGGESFINKRISESPFLPDSGIFFGDYTNIVANDDIIRPIWTRLHSGQLSLWTDITPLSQLLTASNDVIKGRSNPVIQYPNPASNITYVLFELHESSMVSLALYDQAGEMIRTIIKNEKMEYGEHVIPINLDELNLTSGTYYIRVSIDDTAKTLRTIVIK